MSAAKFLNGERVLVIGGSSGIGLAAARAAHDAGAEVVIGGRSAERLRRAVETLRAERAGGVFATVAVDVNDDASVSGAVAAAGRVDHVLITAGSTSLLGVNDARPVKELLSAFDERVQGALRVVRALAGRVKAGGSFVLTGGLSTDRPVRGAWISGLGTAAAEQLARVLALELAPVRFNAISPGWTDTPMWDGVLGENKGAVLADVASKTPIGRIISADEVASAAVFLMGNRAITGEVLHIDGGQRLV